MPLVPTDAINIGALSFMKSIIIFGTTIGIGLTMAITNGLILKEFDKHKIVITVEVFHTNEVYEVRHITEVTNTLMSWSTGNWFYDKTNQVWYTK